MPSQKILKAKQDKVTVLAEKLKKSKMVVFSEYRGITVSDDTALRSNVRQNGDEYMVLKNSIIVHACKEAGIEGVESLEGPTSIVIGYEDYVSPAKVIADFAKNHDFYKIKAGIMDGKAVSLEEVNKLAKLPSKETLYSMVASALLGNIRNLAVVLDQTREKIETEA